MFPAATGLPSKVLVVSVRKDGCGDLGGGVAFQPGVALCWQLGRSTERLHAEASRQNEKLPHAGTFSVHLLQVCALHWLCLGINPHHWKSFVCSQVLDQQLPFPFSGTGVELASGVRPLCACMTGYI